MNKTLEELLIEESFYPFSSNYLLVILNTTDQVVVNTIQEATNASKIFNHNDQTILFLTKKEDLDLEQIIKAINDDLGESYKINEGIVVSTKTEISELDNYLKFVDNYFKKEKKEYSTYLSIVNSSVLPNRDSYLELINSLVMKDLLSDERTYEILSAYFKNNLNVSKTSQELFVSRSSLLFKFDYLKKHYNIDMQRLDDVCAVYILFNM